MRRAEAEHRTVSQVEQTALRAYADGRYDAIEPNIGHVSVQGSLVEVSWRCPVSGCSLASYAT